MWPSKLPSRGPGFPETPLMVPNEVEYVTGPQKPLGWPTTLLRDC